MTRRGRSRTALTLRLHSRGQREVASATSSEGVPISRNANSAWNRLRRSIARVNRPCAVPWLVISPKGPAWGSVRLETGLNPGMRRAYPRVGWTRRTTAGKQRGGRPRGLGTRDRLAERRSVDRRNEVAAEMPPGRACSFLPMRKTSSGSGQKAGNRSRHTRGMEKLCADSGCAFTVPKNRSDSSLPDSS